GSVTVKKGQRVTTGQTLGLIGMSGMTEFPHLHFEVRLHGVFVDPFVGVTNRAGCGFVEKPLWSENALKNLAYVPTGLLGSGFTSKVPRAEDVRKGKHRAEFLSALSPAIIFWTDVFGVQAGDEVKMRILAPTGEVLTVHEDILKKPQAQRFLYIGRRRKAGLWQTGTYVGEYALRRRASGKTPEVINIRRKVEVR
ncbi:MAG: M23 family metallopeptidase, partial [Thermodesulfobacteriota bacterium]|nr:M23 family metallopeptidase [Thermodesulfobacteriota bacterium]